MLVGALFHSALLSLHCFLLPLYRPAMVVATVIRSYTLGSDKPLHPFVSPIKEKEMASDVNY